MVERLVAPRTPSLPLRGF